LRQLFESVDKTMALIAEPRGPRVVAKVSGLSILFCNSFARIYIGKRPQRVVPNRILEVLDENLLSVLLFAPTLLFAQARFDGTWEMKMDTLEFSGPPEDYLLNDHGGNRETRVR
jgi:hypothetical protein